MSALFREIISVVVQRGFLLFLFTIVAPLVDLCLADVQLLSERLTLFNSPAGVLKEICFENLNFCSS